MQEQEQNRSEPATPFKLSEAKRRGQVAKSLDFNSAFVVCGLLAALAMWGEDYWRRLGQSCAQLFAMAGSAQIDAAGVPALGAAFLWAGLGIVLPVAAAGVVMASLGNLVQTGPIFSGEPLKPKFERINPIAGFKRIYSKRMLFDVVKSVIKLALFGGIAYGFFSMLWPSLTANVAHDAVGQVEWLGSHMVTLLVRLGLVLLVIGVVDFAYTRWQFGQQMMMSRREVKEEVKRREGDPQVRARIRELQRENLKQAKSLRRVPEADVLITNPQHLAIALRYDRERMSAPVVIAKGAEAWAAEMRAIAARHGVPTIERKPLARFLFRRAGIDELIPGECFVDVARVYAEVNRQRREHALQEVRP